MNTYTLFPPVHRLEGSYAVSTKISSRRQKPPLNPDRRKDFTRLEQLPNIGPRMAKILRRLRVTRPQDLRGRDAYQMYGELCQLDGTRYDPCVLDVFLSVIEFMHGKPSRPWWKFTAERKRQMDTCAGRMQ